MKVIKEYCGSVKIYTIRTNTYTSNLDHFNWLADIAKADLPQARNIKIVQYGGRHYKGTFGIEFLADGEPHNGYSLTNELEFTL